MKKTLIVLAATAAIVFSSCRTQGSYGLLISQEWTLDEIIYDDSTYTISPPSEVSIIFSDSGTVYGRSTCNSYFGIYEPLEFDRVNIEIKGSTLAYCPYMDFEERYFALLDLSDSYTAESDNLRIRNENNRVTLIYRPSFIQ